VRIACVALLSVGFSQFMPAKAESAESNFEIVSRACVEWILNSASWIDGADGFPERIGMGETLIRAEKVEEKYLPPASLRTANYHWIAETPSERSQFVLTVSDRIPFCHIYGAIYPNNLDEFEAFNLQDYIGKDWSLIEPIHVDQKFSTFEFKYETEEKLRLIVTEKKTENYVSAWTAKQIVGTAFYHYQRQVSPSENVDQ